MDIKEFFYINLHIIDGLEIEFTACPVDSMGAWAALGFLT